MDKKSKYFFLIFFIVIAVVVVVTFFKYFVWKDYYIKAEAECDPSLEACFIYTCTPEEDPECPEDEADRTSFYKYINKKAYAIPLTDPNSEDFPGLECREWEREECEEILCSEETVGEGEECNDPEKYRLENPVEEEEECEGEECAEENDSSGEENDEEGGDVSDEEDDAGSEKIEGDDEESIG